MTTEPQVLSECADLEVGEVIASRYEIVGILGHGAAGAVYRARDRVLDEAVAIKLLRHIGDGAWTPEGFRCEVKLARRVAHPNVCRIHEYGEHDDRPFLSMELIEGPTVKQRLAQRGRYPVEEAVDLAIQLADALDAIHRAGIVHRDLKPQNLIEDRSGAVKVTDFGIATARDAAGFDRHAHYVAGTPEYMSPEQVRGLPVDARSDIYALGVVLFELLTGRVPFPVSSPSETLPVHLQEDRPVPACTGLPQTIDVILRRALAPRREDRFPDAASMATALRAAREGLTQPAALATGPLLPRPESIETLTHPRLPVPAPPVRTARAAWAALAAGALAVAGVAGWAAFDGLRAPRVSVAPASREASVGPAPASSPARQARSPALATPAGSSTLSSSEPTASLPAAAETPAPEPIAEAADPEPPQENSDAERPVMDVAWLKLGITPWAHVFVNDVPVGTTPMRPVTLTPGTHTIRLENPDYEPVVRKVRVQAGETATLRIELPLDAIRRR